MPDTTTVARPKDTKPDVPKDEASSAKNAASSAKPEAAAETPKPGDAGKTESPKSNDAATPKKDSAESSQAVAAGKETVKAESEPSKDAATKDSKSAKAEAAEGSAAKSAPPVAAAKKADAAATEKAGDGDLESEIRAKIEKEIAERKSDKASSTQVIDPGKSATIEAEVRKQLDDEITQRQADKGKADDAKETADAGKPGAKGKNGKAGAGKRKRTKKKIGSQTRPQMSEREQRILEEKANIDAKLRKRNKYVYAAITGFTLLGIALLYMKGRAASNAPSSNNGGTTIKQVEGAASGTSSSPSFRASATFKKATEAANALVRSRDYQGAIDYYRAHLEKFPNDAEACEKAIAQINDNYVNPKPLPPPDPKAQRRTKFRKKNGKARFDSEGGLIPDDDFGVMEEDLDDPFGDVKMPATDPLVPAAPAADPFDAGLLIDDKGLLDEPKKKEKPDDPFGDVDNLLE